MKLLYYGTMVDALRIPQSEFEIVQSDVSLWLGREPVENAEAAIL